MMVGGSDRVVEEESLVLHPNPHEERVKRHLLPGIGKGYGVDRGPFDATRVEEFVDVGTDLDPGACNRAVVDRTGLANEALRLRALVLRPGRARFVDAGSIARGTVKVPISVGIIAGETGRIRDDPSLVTVEPAELVCGR